MTEMNSLQEQKIQELATAFEYPPTPDIAGRIRPLLATPPKKSTKPNRRLAWALVLLLLAASLLAVPSVRAALVQIFRAGGITIFVGEEVGKDDLPPSLSEQLPSFTKPIMLDEVETRVPSLELPTELGLPDDVLLHEENVRQTAVIFLWRDDEEADQIGWTLYRIESQNFAAKQAEMLQVTTVNGREAFWVNGPHLFLLSNNTVEAYAFVEGSVLIWWVEGITYRLEGAASLSEAVRVAESMQQIEK